MKRSVLQDKIEEFIKKFYLNRLLQGLLVGFGGLLIFFLSASIIEYFGNFGTTVRGTMVVLFVGFGLYVLVKYFVHPFLQLNRLTKTISYSEASQMIGKHFPEIKDKLLNTIQLQEQAEHSNNELLLASINQRIQTLHPFKFSSAIDIGLSVKKYAKYTLLPMLVLFGILIFQSSMISKPVERLLNFNKEFVKEAPFEFVLLNPNLNVIKNSDYLIEVELKGKNLPSDLFVELDGHLIKMEQSNKTKFSYKLNNLTAEHVFKFTDNEFESATYELKVLPNPALLDFSILIHYPDYISRKDESLNNIGDVTVPEGTEMEWVFTTKDAEKFDFYFEKTAAEVTKVGNQFKVKAKIMGPVKYSLLLSNQFVKSKDSIQYSIQTIPDRFPGIAAEQTKDSINPFVYYFYGKADDDYGLSKLQFVYGNISKGGIKNYLPVNIGKGTDEIFYYMMDLRTLNVKEDEELEYYFEVFDNDAVHGRKSSKSQIFKVISPSEKSLRQETENGNSSLKQKMSQLMKDIETLKKKGSDLKREMNESHKMDWQQEQKVKDYLNEQKKLEKKLEDLKKENEALNEKQNQLKPLDEELLKKQQELNKLMNEVLTPEMKEMIKKMEEMLKKQNTEGIKEQLDKLNNNQEDLKKQLDRSLEQFKQLELEKKIKEQADALQELAKEQEDLAKKTEEKSASQEELKKEQEEINQKFEDLKNEIEESEKKNQELETPLNIEDTKKEQEKIEGDLNESSEELEKKQNKKASQKQKSAAEQMKELSEKMKKSLEEAQDEQQEEDYYTLRQILENLIELSVQQEDLMSQMKEHRSYSPKYVELSSKQQKLKEMIETVEDSLFALSKRQISIQTYVNKEIGNINNYMSMSISDFSRVDTRMGISHQQYVMTGLNNLALMLSESLKNMQEDMKEKQENKAQCNNPGKGKPKKKGNSGKPKAGSLKQLQEGLNKEMKQLQQNQKDGKQNLSEAFAKIAAKQEAIRREIERLEKMLKEEGKSGALGDLDKTKKLMEEQERDLVNKQLNPESMQRIQEIETRMLEHEKAENEQDMDNTREAEQAKEVENKMPPAIKAYLEKKAKEMELIRSVPAELTPYYKDKVRVYFQKLSNA
jgi:hypothetical protein